MVLEINTLDVESHKNMGPLSIAVGGSKVTRSKNQRHLGILLKDENGNVNLLHLAWHKVFRLESPGNNVYCWLPACKGIKIEIVESFCDWLLELWDLNKDDIGYSLLYDYNKDYFDDITGMLEIEAPGTGLTCATFVIECFKSYGLNFLKLDSWPARNDDINWISNILNLMEEKNVPKEHISIQRNDLNIIRFRPEEVAAAASISESGSIIEFSDVERHSSDLLCLLDEYGML